MLFRSTEEEKAYKGVAAILGLEASGVLASRFGTRDGWRKVDMAEELDQKQCEERLIRYVALVEDMRAVHHKCVRYLREDIKSLGERLKTMEDKQFKNDQERRQVGRVLLSRRRRDTRSHCDWSSEVCSSDLK